MVLIRAALTLLTTAALSMPAAAEIQIPIGAKSLACAKLHDVIRISTDRILGGTDTNRVLVALSAAERLDCNIKGLLDALRLTVPAVPSGDERDRPAVRRDSDYRK